MSIQNDNKNAKRSDSPPLRIQIVSDLHIEFYHNKHRSPNFLIEPQAPVLALLGDIGYACSEQLCMFLHSQCDRFEQVLFVAGNHEYYNRTRTTYGITEQNEWLKTVCSERENLHFLEKESMTLNGILILATTLWSEIPDEYLWQAETSMNDYNLSYNHNPGEAPRKLTAIETRNYHRESHSWLRSQLTEAKQKGQKVVVLTHHTPLLKGTSHPQYEGSELSCCFSSNLKSLLVMFGPPIVAWACGHTHYNFDFMVGNVRVCSNQRGYKDSPKKDYDRGGVILEVYP